MARALSPLTDASPVVFRGGHRLDATVQALMDTVIRAAANHDPGARRWLAAWLHNDRSRIHREFYVSNARLHGERRRLCKREAFGSHTAEEWQAVLERHSHRCAACGARGPLERDHVVPLCAGGCDLALNLQPLCKSCNSAKGGRILPGTQLSIFDRVHIARTSGQRFRLGGKVAARFCRGNRA